MLNEAHNLKQTTVLDSFTLLLLAVVIFMPNLVIFQLHQTPQSQRKNIKVGYLWYKLKQRGSSISIG